MYSYKNKTKQRYKTQHFYQTYQTPKHDSRLNTYHSQSQSQLPKMLNQPTNNIILNLEKHIQYLQKKLHELQTKYEATCNSNQWLKGQYVEKEEIVLRLNHKIEQHQAGYRQLNSKFQNLKTDMSNYRLQQKVDQLNRDLTQKREVERKQSPSKSPKKDKFSSAFLPSPFGSPKPFQEKPSQIYESFSKQSIVNSSQSSKNPFEDALWSEWRKMKNGKSRKQKEIVTLQTKLEQMKQEWIKARKQTQRVKAELMRAQQRSTLQISKLKGRIVNYMKDQKILKNKLKLCEQKMAQFSVSLKGQGDSQKFFAHSSALELQQIFEKISHNLEFESATIDITIEKQGNNSIQCQTYFNDDHEEKINELQQSLQKLKGEMSQKEKEWDERMEEANSTYLNELKDASDMMDLYKCRIQHLNKVISDAQKEKKTEDITKQACTTQQCQVLCDIINYEQWEQHEQIMKRVRQLVQLNDSLTQKIAQLEEEKQYILKEQEELQARIIQQRLFISATKQNESNNEESSCKNCTILKQKIAQKNIQALQFTRKISKLQSEKNHFQNSFQDKLNQYSHLEDQTSTEIQRLQADLKEKSKSLSLLILESEEKGEENQRLKEEMKQLKMDVTDLKSKIQEYEEDESHHQNRQ